MSLSSVSLLCCGSLVCHCHLPPSPSLFLPCQVPPGEFGARAGLVFLLDSDEPKGQDFIENFSDFDHWTSELWRKYQHKLANHEEIDEDTFFKKEDEEDSEEGSERREVEKDKEKPDTSDSQRGKKRIFPVAFLEPHKES